MQNYYRVRDASSDFATYWKDCKDPDGNVRDRLSESERAAYVASIADELAFIGKLKPGRLLDFGCGPGWLLREISPEWDILGIEVAPHAIAECDAHGVPVIRSIDGVYDCSADAVVCYHVIEHLRDPIDAIRQIRRVLRPGGWLILGTPDFGSPCAQRFGDNYRMLHDPTHCSLFTLESMHRFLCDAAFEVDNVAFPFPEKYATAENFARWNDTNKISPPWPGNWMTFYARRACG